MNKYNVGDKVVIRKDLEVDEFYNGMYWLDEMEYLKEKDYVLIDKVTINGDYYVNDWYITEEMISHKYEESGNKYNVGDKVVIRKDLVVGEYYGIFAWRERKEYMKELDYVVIEDVDEDGDYWVDGGIITDEMIEGLYGVIFHSKYKIGDKVVIRKDLEIGEYYGEQIWNINKKHLKEKKYVIINEVCGNDKYLTEDGYWISYKMIEGLYQENSETEKSNIKGSINDNIEYKVDDPVLFDSITSFHIDRLVNKALEENNTEMLLKISEYMKGGGHIEFT